MKSNFILESQNNLDFLHAAYKTILGRAPDEVGLKNYLNRINQGTSRYRIILELITSPEAKFRGFDSTEIEDIIQFYLKSKNNPLLRKNLDRLIFEKYADRIYNFFNRLHLSSKSNTTQKENLTQCDFSKLPRENSYMKTREQADSILENLYTNIRTHPRTSLIDETLGIHVPRWKGVTNSTKAFFPHTFPIPLSSEQAPEDLSEDEIKAITESLIDSKFSQLVFSGGEYLHYRIAKKVKDEAPHKRIKLVWHGSPRQLGPHYELDPFLAWVDAVRNGMCDAIATVKPGMIRLFEALNVRAHFLQNSVTSEPRFEEDHSPADVVGMWISHVGNFNKPVVPTLFALARLRNITLQGSGFSEEGIQLIQRLKIPHKFVSPSTVSHKQVIEGMRTSKLTIYITLSECMPMVPFESISEGAPCLVGPATRLYDDPFLEERLVVKDPFDSVEISNKIKGAIEDYDVLRKASIEFLLRAKNRAAKNLLEFLS